MDTEALIATLVGDLRPVRRLASPGWRLAAWLGLAVPASAAVVAVMGLRPDIAAKLGDATFAGQEIAMLATAVVAGWAALAAGVPGYPRWVQWAPAVPTLAWLATLGRQCWQDWQRLGLGGMPFNPELSCLASIAAVGVIPALAILVLVRRGHPLGNTAAVFWGALAAAAMANAGLRLFHAHDAALMVILWQFGSVAAFTALATAAKDHLVPGPQPRRAAG